MSEQYRPRATTYLVHWSSGKMGGFDREDVLLCAIAENRQTSIGDPVTIWKLCCTMPTIYEPITVEELTQKDKPLFLTCDNPAPSFASEEVA